MKTTFDAAPAGAGRIAYVVYILDGEGLERKVTTSPNENVYDAIQRELVRLWRIPVNKLDVLQTGEQYKYTFIDGQVKIATVL